jgi:hypothetical protein
MASEVMVAGINFAPRWPEEFAGKNGDSGLLVLKLAPVPP